MQRIILNLTCMLAAIGIISTTACSKSNAPLIGSTIHGTWKISYLWDKQDLTSRYNNYTFDFDANGTLTAFNGQQSYSGTWKTGVDDSKDKFVIQFLGIVPSDLSRLSEDWIIVEITATSMHLTHGGGSNPDILKFTK